MMRRAPKVRGYTAVEVLLSMTVFAIGAAGVIAMQRTAVQGNLDARRLDVANSIARAWTERLRRDAMTWTTAANLSQSTILSDAVNNPGWRIPFGCDATFPDGTCAAFDAFGHDIGHPTAPTHVGNPDVPVFCANVRADIVAQHQTSPAVVRIMVRVYWPKGLGQAAYGTSTDSFCSTSALGDLTKGPDAPTASQIYHFVQDVTLVTRTVLPQ